MAANSGENLVLWERQARTQPIRFVPRNARDWITSTMATDAHIGQMSNYARLCRVVVAMWMMFFYLMLFILS